MGWGNKFPDLKNDPSYLEPRLTAVEATANSNTSSLAEKAQQSDLNTTNANVVANTSAIANHTTQISANATAITNIGNGSPKGTYSSLSALQTAYPTGTTGVYITSDTGHWYYWNGSAWTDGGLYQSTGIANGSVTPAMTSFMTQSENIIDPTKRSDGHFLSYNYNVDVPGTYTTGSSGTVYTQTFPAASGDVYYSNSPGRLVWYSAGTSGVVKGNATFSLDSTTGLYKGTVGSGAAQVAFDGYISNINVDGYWFVCKGTAWSGTKSQFGSSKLNDNVVSNTLGKQSDVTSLQTRVGNLETPTANATFFVPHYLYCYDSNKTSKWIPKYNVMMARNSSDFYLDITAGWGFNRDWERVQTQDTDTVSIKNTVSGATVYTKQYTRRNAIPANKTNPSTAKNVLIIGDSYTDNGYIPTDIKNQVVNTYGFSNFNFIGTKTDTLNGVTCANEGRGGYAIDDFTKTDNTQGRGTTYPNPFLIGGTVNFATYMSTNGFSGNIDYCIIELGVNNLVGGLGDTPDTIKPKMQALIDKILASYPSCKVFVCGLLMISKINAVYDIVSHNTNALNVNKNFEALCESSPYSANCFYVDTAAFFDSEYGFQYSFTPYRGSTENHKVQTDWLHPSEAGYYMMTDTIASAFIYNF